MCFLGVQMCTGLDFHSLNSNFYVFQSELPVDKPWFDLDCTEKHCIGQKFCLRHIPPHSQANIMLLPGRILWSSPALCMSEGVKKYFARSDAVKFPGLVCTVFHCSRYLKNPSRKLNLMSGLKPLSSWLIFWSSCFLHFSLALPFFSKLWNVRPLFCLIQQHNV